MDLHGDLVLTMSAALGATLEAGPQASVHGGCIAESFRWSSSLGPLFVKLVPSSSQWVLDAEADGLAALCATDCTRVPRVLACGAAAAHAYLVLEWIDLHPGTTCDGRLGEALAAIHRHSSPHFGWQRDNAIGTTAQCNAWNDEWPAFFREQRLRKQLALAAQHGYGGRLQARGESLLERMHALFESYHPQPALLHGDLWSGNYATDEHGAPVLFDPAVYFGDREADIAMTRLFGGFSASFYDAYQHAWPLDPGARARVDLYNLYHVLNHLNLFGGGYRAQAEQMMNRVLSHLGA